MTSAAEPVPPSTRPAAGLVLGFVGVVIFGATLPMTRIAVGTFDPLFVTVARAAFAGLLATAVLIVLRRPFPPPQARKSLAVAAVMTVFGFPFFSAVAMLHVPASHGGVVLGILPLATSVAAVFVNRERPSPAFWAWSLAGAILVLAFSLRDADGSVGWGDLALLAAAGAAAVGYANFARVGRWMSGWESISWALALSAPLTLSGTLVAFDPAYLAAPWPAVAALGYVSVFSMFVGFFFWSAGLAAGGVARVGQVQLLQTFVTLAVAAAMNREPLTFETVGFAMAVVVVVLAARNQKIAKSP